MVSQVKKSSWSASSWNKKVIVFLTLFIAYEVGFTVVAKPAARKVTILNKAGRYLTIGKQGITGKYVYSPYAKLKIHSVGFRGEVTIKAIMMRKYLAMDSTGNVTLVSRKTKEAVFIDQRNTGIPFALIRSKTFPSRYLAINGTGFVHGSTNTKTDDAKFAIFSAV